MFGLLTWQAAIPYSIWGVSPCQMVRLAVATFACMLRITASLLSHAQQMLLFLSAEYQSILKFFLAYKIYFQVFEQRTRFCCPCQDYILGARKDAGHTSTSILVRGGLYEVDLLRRQLAPCYWPGTAHRALRATWFMEKAPDWVPLKARNSS